jgi:hypothetical protein
MPNRIETPVLSEGDQTWLASTRGIRTNQTVKLKLSAFTITNGYIPSGTPLAITGTGAAQEAVPFVFAGSGGNEKLAGFLFTDQPVVTGTADTHINVPLLDTGRIRTSRLPVAFTEPTAANARGQFVYVTN